MVDLEDLARNMEKIEGTHNVPFDDLFNVRFMTEYTEFVTIDDMFESAGFKVDNEEDFNNILEEKLDKFIREHTRFSSWKEMLNKAGEYYIIRNLGLQLI